MENGMTDSLLTPHPPHLQGRGAGSGAAAVSQHAKSPPEIPDQFWDASTGTARLDALLRSYLQMEKKLATFGGREPPDTPEEYQIEIANELLSSDRELNKRLHAAGFTQQQAQLVYDLAAERLLPMVAEIAAVFEAEGQVARLTQHFGSEQRWRQVARQIDAWGRSHLPSQVFEALSTTAEGVIAMHRMMANAEPGLIKNAGPPDEAVSEGHLKKLMRDPRYWRDQDPALVERVRDGFRRLYRD
jgi:hypothetical protein